MVKITNKNTIDEAKRLKEEGNAFYKEKKYKEAFDMYTEALLLPSLPDRERAMLHSNRSATYCALGQHGKAVKEADRAIKLWPSWVKPYFRKGMAFHEMGKYEKAIKGKAFLEFHCVFSLPFSWLFFSQCILTKGCLSIRGRPSA